MAARKLTGYLFVILTLCALSAIVWADYTVKADDTLTSISQSQLGSTAHWQEIAQLNGLKPPYSLSVGQTLKMPGDTPNDPPPFIVTTQQNENSSQPDSPASKPNRIFNLQTLLFKLTSIGNSLLKAGIFFRILCAITMAGFWAVSMRLNCNIMILPEKVSFGQCFKLAVIHLLLWITYVLSTGLIVLLPRHKPIISAVIIGIFVITIVLLIIYTTKKTIDTGWFWAFLFLAFSYTVTCLLLAAVYLVIAVITLGILAIVAIF